MEGVSEMTIRDIMEKNVPDFRVKIAGINAKCNCILIPKRKELIE